jgi:hypothetical protein
VADLLYSFCLRDPVEVIRFVRDHHELPLLLAEAKERIADVFGPRTPLILQVVRDPEAEEHRPELSLFIETGLSVDEARAKLAKLDDGWWLDAMPRANGWLNIALEYV